MGARKGNNLLIVEAHTVKDITEMGGILGSIREILLWGTALCTEAITTSRPPGDSRALRNKAGKGKFETTNPLRFSNIIKFL